mmetsp:Transcript_16242/g.37615  ORF Transcript_16242/g.37615 Transcript_16242/m.37615 type:complete len:897 (-) Transcript_16242:164-2854(-)|eukprot:CAMPEP_0197184850 /NCGR_PEP_ID=MMETSP1423-20130617/10707_1 /TAXON_ID=476441 /ORGANISM="Pseudo-nitzschia heimii, Strain UNC1101" /LENGTH=896 /DNA_ID=CAMNT_0042635773 /DNA_START=162 /DNA_END=2852 /DNA_ORIENTATION=-
MSHEWMKKFQEIGQKGKEEVTAMGDEGFETTSESRRGSMNEGTLSQSSIESSYASSRSGNKSDDAAALFRAAGKTSNSIGAGTSYDSIDPPADTSSEVVSSEVQSSEPTSSDLVSSSANQSSTIISSTVTSSYAGSSDDSSSEGIDTDDALDETSEDENGAESSQTPIAGAEKKDEEFGESWVVDKDNLNRCGSDEVDSQSAANATRPSLHQEESFITEAFFVDEDGNEILVDENEIEVHENSNEIQVDEGGDEIEVDEDGNEIQVEENNTKIQVDEDGNEIQEEEILVEESVMDLVPQHGQDPNTVADRTMERRSDEPHEEARRTIPLGSAPIDNFEEQQRILGVGKKGNRSRMSWLIPLLVFAIIVSSILLVIFLVVYNEEREFYGATPTMAPTPINYLPLEPTASSSSSIDAAATTEFDDIQNDCDFMGLVQPNVVDQCNCGNGKVDLLANDVRERWKELVDNFIPTVFSQWNEPMNSCSPKNQALLWLSSGINNGGETDTLHILQRYVLAVIYYEQGGTQWRGSSNWLSEKSVCEWEGVECNTNRFVRILTLDRNGLRGQLSDIPTLLNAIEAYFVSDNNLVGTIPVAYFRDDTLRYIDFSGNDLTGKFPSNLSGSKLNRIILASNKLDGFIPSQIGSIKGLEVLNIESNAFSGTLPSSLFILTLKELSIGGNRFSGSIPGNLADVPTLTSISLGPNQFTGDLPTNLDKLSALERLSIVGVPALSGRLPASYGLSLKNLVELTISGTNIDGNIPDFYDRLTKLDTLRLSNNNIRGTIPSTLSSLTNMKRLSLNGNSLTGTISTELGELSSLQVLELQMNSLSGMIPTEFGDLSNIRSLLFNGNTMSGRAPDEVCALRDAELYQFIVDCPVLVDRSEVDGIICSIPDCCSQCL